MKVYQCEDSLESVFTAIYNAYEEKCDHSDTRLSIEEEYLLFAEYYPVKTDLEKVEKVIRTLRKRFGEEDYERLCFCLTTSDPDKAQAVYQTVVKGLSGGVRPGHLFDQLTDHNIHLAFSLARGATNELHHLYGFLRFQELEQGILYAKIGPKNHILTYLMPHFADRFPMENFMIYDDHRDLFGIHPAGGEWYLLHDTQFQAEGVRFTESEVQIQELFRQFCHTIAIEARSNPKLQQNMLPLRFREYMVEF